MFNEANMTCNMFSEANVICCQAVVLFVVQNECVWMACSTMAMHYPIPGILGYSHFLPNHD